MGSCYVVGCHSGDNSKIPHHKFTISKSANEETRRQWIVNIPKRKDKPWDFESCKICHLHFEDRFLVKTIKVMMGDVIVSEHPRKKWMITSDAVPTLFSNSTLPSYYDRKTPDRRPPKKRYLPTVGGNRVQGVSNLELTSSQTCYHESIEQAYDKTIISSVTDVSLPDNWFTYKTQEGIGFYKVIHVPGMPMTTFQTERSVEIRMCEPLRVTILMKSVSKKFNTEINTVSELEKLIQAVDQGTICKGLVNFNIVKTFRSAFRCCSAWFSEGCHVFVGMESHRDNIICSACLAMKGPLQKEAMKTTKQVNKSKVSSETLKKLRKQKNQAAQKIRKLNLQNRKLKSSVRLIETKFRTLEETKLENVINEQDLNNNFKLALITSAKLQKAKSNSGRRYPTDWLLQSLLLKITSPKAYRYLRNEGVLPLPSPNHITKLLRGLPCEFGFSNFIFKQLEAQFKSKDRKDRQVFLAFDEMKVRETITFDKAAMQFTGFIDYSDFSQDLKQRTDSRKEADHALVFMVRSLNSKMTQPIGSFATRGSAPGNFLAKMILSCIVRCEQAGLEVVGVVCDGALNNKSAWKALGVAVNAGVVTNKISNPSDERRQVHFLCDVPHIFKCIRNNFQKLKWCSFRGQAINWDFYSALFDADSVNQIRAVPKLSHHHINPGPFQKMVVAFAVQVFSKSVADAIAYYRDVIGNQNLKYSEATENFTRLLNELFDALNARVPREGLTPNSQAYKTISDFLMNLRDTDTFASDLTTVSLQITLQSVLDLIDYLCNDVGFGYVLTSKFNQDCLEKFFGLIRSFGGDDAHPTISSFGHLYRLLSVYSPTSKILHSNVRVEEDHSVCSVSYMELLCSMRLTRTQEMANYKKKVSEDLLLKTFYSESENSFVSNGSSDKNMDPQDGILYHLAGYIAFKRKLFTDCETCKVSLSDKTYNPLASALTDLKDLGGLMRPSEKLHTLIVSIEPHLTSLSQSALMSKDIIPEIVSTIDNLNIFGIGCSKEHSEILATRIILYYITIRLFFLSKIYNREMLSSSIKTKQKMKEAKLK